VPPEARALVTGASSLVGTCLLERLRGRGLAVRAFSRSAPPRADGVEWAARDIGNGLGAPDGRARCLFHVAPLWLLPSLLGELPAWGVERVVAFGSTSRFTKARSPSARERDVAERLARAEDALAARSGELGLSWTLFRPTMIYGRGRDRNVSSIARFARAAGFFPLAGDARGRRQPVHAEDLAIACLQALDNPRTYGRAYNLAGGTTLTYREMVELIFRGLGRKPRLLSVPRAVLGASLAAASWVPGLGHLTPEMAGRMEEDLVFDTTQAADDFGYSPRPFRFPDHETTKVT
jgi:nucleoside-diphosphate-sugar epimerase